MKYLLFLFLWSCTAEMPTDNYIPITTTFSGQDLEFFNDLNQIRVSSNLKPLKAEFNLTKGCTQHSVYMNSLDSINHDYFWQRYINSKSKGFAEVISYGFTNAQGQIAGYQSSVEHYQILINPIYTHIGIANSGTYQTVNLAYYDYN